MKEKIVSIVGNILLYFVIVFMISIIFHKAGWLTVPALESAVFLTIGWGIWKMISYGVNKLKK